MTGTGRTWVIGAGMAGLAAALSLSAAGRAVTLVEAAARAGGRCRSYHDPVLDRLIDNGNHLMMTANDNLFALLAETGATDRMRVVSPAAYPFIDVTTGERWTVRPNAGRLPWWILVPGRRVAGTRALDYLAGARLLTGPADATVTERIRPVGMLWRRFWEPLAIGALNIDPARGAAGLLATVCRLSFAKGEAASRPVMARTSLADALFDPAVATLERRGVVIRFRERLRGVSVEGGRIAARHLAAGTEGLGPGDRVILALPPWVAGEVVPGLVVPDGAHMILNLHYRLDRPPAMDPPFIGLTGSVAQWVFLKGDVASVTVSAADAFAETPAEEIATRLWPEVRLALGLGDLPEPPCRVVKEKRATFAGTPANEARRPGPKSPFDNLFLAGDWTVRGFPATIEGAILSGRCAAASAQG
ncbi:MAG: hydroxysqualene dehydroxylase HpnE [Pseudomonadota bacterium]|nr:hydroxysqualene dehydroxylase HpnE [Pseudomonadota bacterium]